MNNKVPSFRKINSTKPDSFIPFCGKILSKATVFYELTCFVNGRMTNCTLDILLKPLKRFDSLYKLLLSPGLSPVLMRKENRIAVSTAYHGAI